MSEVENTLLELWRKRESDEEVKKCCEKLTLAAPSAARTFAMFLDGRAPIGTLDPIISILLLVRYDGDGIPNGLVSGKVSIGPAVRASC